MTITFERAIERALANGTNAYGEKHDQTHALVAIAIALNKLANAHAPPTVGGPLTSPCADDRPTRNIVLDILQDALHYRYDGSGYAWETIAEHRYGEFLDKYTRK